jgi:hypothetical protein
VIRVTRRPARTAYKLGICNRALGVFMTLQSLFPPLLLPTQEKRRMSWWRKLIAAIAADRERRAKACVAEHLPYHADASRGQFTGGDHVHPER